MESPSRCKHRSELNLAVVADLVEHALAIEDGLVVFLGELGFFSGESGDWDLLHRLEVVDDLDSLEVSDDLRVPIVKPPILEVEGSRELPEEVRALLRTTRLVGWLGADGLKIIQALPPRQPDRHYVVWHSLVSREELLDAGFPAGVHGMSQGWGRAKGLDPVLRHRLAAGLDVPPDSFQKAQHMRFHPRFLRCCAVKALCCGAPDTIDAYVSLLDGHSVQPDSHGNDDDVLAAAVRQGRDDLVAQLIELGARPGSGRPGAATVELAIGQGCPTMLKRLIDAWGSPLPRYAVLPSCGVGGRDPLWALTVERDDLAAMEVLRDNGVEFGELRDEWGLSPLTLAIRFGSFSAAELLLRWGASTDELDDRGLSPLMGAVNSRNLDRVRWLLDRAADPRTVNPHGFTALHLAAIHDDVATAALLLEHGASLSALTVDGWSPHGLARDHGSAEALAFFEERGGAIGAPDHAGRSGQVRQFWEQARWRAPEGGRESVMGKYSRSLEDILESPPGSEDVSYGEHLVLQDRAELVADRIKRLHEEAVDHRAGFWADRIREARALGLPDGQAREEALDLEHAYYNVLVESQELYDEWLAIEMDRLFELAAARPSEAVRSSVIDVLLLEWRRQDDLDDLLARIQGLNQPTWEAQLADRMLAMSGEEVRAKGRVRLLKYLSQFVQPMLFRPVLERWIFELNGAAEDRGSGFPQALDQLPFNDPGFVLDHPLGVAQAGLSYLLGAK